MKRNKKKPGLSHLKTPCLPCSYYCGVSEVIIWIHSRSCKYICLPFNQFYVGSITLTSSIYSNRTNVDLSTSLSSFFKIGSIKIKHVVTQSEINCSQHFHQFHTFCPRLVAREEKYTGHKFLRKKHTSVKWCCPFLSSCQSYKRSKVVIYNHR